MVWEGGDVGWVGVGGSQAIGANRENRRSRGDIYKEPVLSSLFLRHRGATEELSVKDISFKGTIHRQPFEGMEIAISPAIITD